MKFKLKGSVERSIVEKKMGKIKKSKKKKRNEPYARPDQLMDTEELMTFGNDNDQRRLTRGKIQQRHKLEYKKLRDEIEKLKEER
jgi:hypothetical protein